VFIKNLARADVQIWHGLLKWGNEDAVSRESGVPGEAGLHQVWWLGANRSSQKHEILPNEPILILLQTDLFHHSVGVCPVKLGPANLMRDRRPPSPEHYDGQDGAPRESHLAENICKGFSMKNLHKIPFGPAKSVKVCKSHKTVPGHQSSHKRHRVLAKVFPPLSQLIILASLANTL
jgi:hypothetical protein